MIQDMYQKKYVRFTYNALCISKISLSMSVLTMAEGVQELLLCRDHHPFFDVVDQDTLTLILTSCQLPFGAVPKTYPLFEDICISYDTQSS